MVALFSTLITSWNRRDRWVGPVIASIRRSGANRLRHVTPQQPMPKLQCERHAVLLWHCSGRQRPLGHLNDCYLAPPLAHTPAACHLHSLSWLLVELPKLPSYPGIVSFLRCLRISPHKGVALQRPQPCPDGLRQSGSSAC